MPKEKQIKFYNYIPFYFEKNFVYSIYFFNLNQQSKLKYFSNGKKIWEIKML
jgi:hypothetical protein